MQQAGAHDHVAHVPRTTLLALERTIEERKEAMLAKTGQDVVPLLGRGLWGGRDEGHWPSHRLCLGFIYPTCFRSQALMDFQAAFEPRDAVQEDPRGGRRTLSDLGGQRGPGEGGQRGGRSVVPCHGTAQPAGEAGGVPSILVQSFWYGMKDQTIASRSRSHNRALLFVGCANGGRAESSEEEVPSIRAGRKGIEASKGMKGSIQCG